MCPVLIISAFQRLIVSFILLFLSRNLSCKASPAPLLQPEVDAAAAAAAAAVAAVSAHSTISTNSVPNYIVGWMMQNPDQQMASLSITSGGTHLVPILISTTVQSNGSASSASKQVASITCQTTADCANHDLLMFCDSHYGVCERQKKETDLCRSDEQCEDSLQCMFGKCQQPIPLGQAGSRCIDSTDCDPNHCCARQLGEKVCKPMLTRGSKCHLPYGGLDYSLNESCSCESGLVCRPVIVRKGKPARVDKMQCS